MKLLPLTAAFALLAGTAFAQDSGATGTFVNAEGTDIGTVQLVQMDDGVHITGDVTGIAAGDHGFHFHAVGACDAATKFDTAGPHFNPDNKKHGLENPDGPHHGDMANLVANDGATRIDVHSDLVSLNKDDPSYIFDADGTSLMIHAAADDQKTDPSGKSGDRIACAVLKAAE